MDGYDKYTISISDEVTPGHSFIGEDGEDIATLYYDKDAIAPESGRDASPCTFTAIINNEEPATKTSISKAESVYKLSWVAGDGIYISGAASAYTASVSGDNVTFTGTGATKDGDVYKAVYPFGIKTDNGFVLPATQSYGEDGGVVSASGIPMYAESSGTTLEFKNLCGVLAVKVTSSEIASVSSMTVSSSNHDMYGVFSVAMSESVPVMELTDESTSDFKSVTLTMGSAVTLDEEGTVFYVAIPPATYKDVTVVVSDGTNSKTMYTTPGKDITISRNKVYPFNFSKTSTMTLYVDVATTVDL